MNWYFLYNRHDFDYPRMYSNLTPGKMYKIHFDNAYESSYINADDGAQERVSPTWNLFQLGYIFKMDELYTSNNPANSLIEDCLCSYCLSIFSAMRQVPEFESFRWDQSRLRTSGGRFMGIIVNERGGERPYNEVKFREMMTDEAAQREALINVSNPTYEERVIDPAPAPRIIWEWTEAAGLNPVPRILRASESVKKEEKEEMDQSVKYKEYVKTLFSDIQFDNYYISGEGVSDYRDFVWENLYTMEVLNEGQMSSYLSTALKRFNPRPCDKDPTRISLYTTDAKSTRTIMKPGKAINLMFPYLTPVQVDRFVDKWKDAFGTKEYVLEWNEDCTQEDFKRIYTAPNAPTNNLNTSYEKKSLANSCMRYDFTTTHNYPYHPAEAYGSGDFFIVAVWLGDKLAARAVVVKKYRHSGPIYAVSNGAHNFLEAAFKERNVKIDSDGWQRDDVRLLALEHPDNGSYIGPYLDFGSMKRQPKNGFFHMTDCCGVSFGAEGQFRTRDCNCNNCGEDVDLNYVMTGPDGQSYCEDCHNEMFTFCESCEEDVDIDQIVSVIQDHGGSCNWCASCANNNATRIQYSSYIPNGWYNDSILSTDAHGDHFFNDGNTHSYCEFSNEYYPNEEITTILDESGNEVQVSETYFIETLNKDNEYIYSEEEEMFIFNTNEQREAA